MNTFIKNKKPENNEIVVKQIQLSSEFNLRKALLKDNDIEKLK